MGNLQRVLCLVALSSAASVGMAQTDTVVDYAKFCYKELGIKATDLDATFDCGKGTLLTTFKNGTPFAGIPAGARSGKNHLAACDAPAWLISGGKDNQCYDATYLQSLSIKGNETFRGALLCRHKISNSDLLTDFDDIAMIWNDSKSGKTCWFQTLNGETTLAGTPTPVKKDGTQVPRPDTDTAGFWYKPSQAANDNCARCHDNGPWMNSQWLYSQVNSFENNPDNLYSTPPYPIAAAPPAPATTAFNWPRTNDFITVGDAGLTPADKTFNAAEQKEQASLPNCTSCHKLSAKVKWSARTNQTYSSGEASNPPARGWFKFVTGMSTPAQATTATAMDYDHTRWMPTITRPDKVAPSPTVEATYDKLYAEHLTQLRACMGLVPAARIPPLACATRKLAFNAVPAAPGSGARVVATDVGTGVPYLSVATPLAAAVAPVPVMVAPGTSLQLGWGADDSFVACTTEATVPPGVAAPSSLGLVGTGSNWPLPQSPPEVGPLTEPGIYDFSMYCDNTYVARLQFQISGQSAAMLQLATMIDSRTYAIAVDAVDLKRLSTTTNVLVNNPAELIWTADNVEADCTLTGPGVSETGNVGTATIVLSGSANQTYRLACMGSDGNSHSVSATLHPVMSSVCNINGEALGKAGAPNRSGNIQLYWTDTSGDPNFPVDHYNIYVSEYDYLDPLITLAGVDSNPFVAAPAVTIPAGQTLEFTDSTAVEGVTTYYQIAPASADDTEYCSPPATPILSATIPAGRP